jgi:hypothetical protein
MKLARPHVLAQGIGGAVFLQALAVDPDVFGETHMVYNMDYPRGNGAVFDSEAFEKQLRWDATQVWFTYSEFADAASNKDEEDVTSAHDFHVKLTEIQKRLQDARMAKKQRDKKPFDELLITKNLARTGSIADTEAQPWSTRIAATFFKDFLASIDHFFSNSPYAFQDTLSRRGLVVPKEVDVARRAAAAKKKAEPFIMDDQAVDKILEHLASKRDKVMRSSKAGKRLMAIGRAAERDVGREKGVKPHLPSLDTTAGMGHEEVNSPGLSDCSTQAPDSPTPEDLLPLRFASSDKGLPMMPKCAPPKLDLNAASIKGSRHCAQGEAALPRMATSKSQTSVGRLKDVCGAVKKMLVG